jgi:hypothetical protein
MALRQSALLLAAILSASPVAASVQEPASGAPPGDADTLYCMWIEPIIGSRIEEVKCWTREEWAQNEVDVDAEWAKEGVAIIENGVRRPA